jgi:outer membrane receptor protein involved in Fe transport
MFDPTFNAPSIGRGHIPMETIKRIEIVSGPGGVLWGANSFLGVVNVISKDADDVDGWEGSVGGGDGPGDSQVLRGYVMTGQKFGEDDSVKVFAHASFDTYLGAIWKAPTHMFSTPLPNPNSLYIYGPEVTSQPKRSLIFNFDGKLSAGAFNFYWNIPYMERYYGMTFPGTIVREEWEEDNLPECGAVPRNDPMILNPPPGERCIDRGRATRQNGIFWYERYGIAEWRTRFAGNRAGLTAKATLIQFVRIFEPIQILAAVPSLLEGGLSFQVDASTYRAGGSIDGDIEVSSKFRVLYGGEALHEWIPDTTTPGGSRQGAGAEVLFWGPFDHSKLPLPCPRDGDWNGTEVTNIRFVEDCPLTFVFSTSRTTLGAFASGQYRPVKSLILDAGARVQVAPEVAELDRGYDPVTIFSGAAVWEFVRDFHLKLNYAEGFRPPVFNNTDSNGEAVEIDGDRDLEVERSRSFQTEVNARVLKGKKRIRELTLRADYSYTVLENFITFVGGRYENVGDRGIHSAEFLAKLYLKGDHRIELAYTWVTIDMADKGAFLAMPEHWFNITSVVNLISGKLEGIGVLKVVGAFEDPNRRVEYRDLEPDPVTGQFSPSDPMQTTFVQPIELVIDRIPPSAELQLGVRFALMKDVTLSAFAYNSLNSARFQPDAFNDLQPRLEIRPTRYESFRFFASLEANF